jgi:hypothetical protein
MGFWDAIVGNIASLTMSALPQIPIFPARYPDLRQAIFDQQPQNQLRILAVRLLLAYSLGTDLGCISYPQLKRNSASNRSNQRACPIASIPHMYLGSLHRQIVMKRFPFLAVQESAFL